MKRSKIILTKEDIEKVRQIKQYVADHLDGNLRLEVLASLFNMSISTIQRHFYATTGNNIHHFIVGLRMEKAKELLRQRVPVDQVGTLVGYTERAAFTHAFHRYTGLTPIDFLKKNQNEMDVF